MSQIATFFNPVALPTVAGATALDANAATPGDSFAATLLNLNALLGIADPNAVVPVEGLPNSELLASLSAPLATPAASADVVPTINVDATLVSQFALLQSIALEPVPQLVPAAAPTTTNIDTDKKTVPAAVAVAIAASELRGSFAAELPNSTQAPATPVQQPQAIEKKSATGAVDVVATKESATPFQAQAVSTPLENITAADPANAAKRETPSTPAATATPAIPVTPTVPATPATSATPANPATRATAATPASPAVTTKRAAPVSAAEPGIIAEQPQGNSQNGKPIDAASTSVVPSLSGESQNSSPDSGQQAPNASTHQVTSPAAVAIAPALPTIIAAQQLNTSLIATPHGAVPLDALAVHIARKFEQGSSEFEIRLHPADLGQLDITLSVAEDGRVQATLRAERPETLELLQRDARTLEQQLRHAGLDVGSNALSFSLSNGQNQRHAPNPAWPAFADANDAASLAHDQALSNYVAVSVRDGIDIRV